MKTTLISLSLVFAFNSAILAASPEEEARFVAEAEKALKAKDIGAFLKLHYLEGVPGYWKEMLNETLPLLIEWPISQVTLAKPKPGEKEEIELTHDGVKYRAALPITQMLRIKFQAQPGTPVDASFAVGEKGGKLFITVAAPPIE